MSLVLNNKRKLDGRSEQSDVVGHPQLSSALQPAVHGLSRQHRRRRTRPVTLSPRA